jgi:hypothetical protein
MTTLSAARVAMRARIEGGNVVDAGDAAVPFRWQNEDKDSAGHADLPDTPAPFVYIEVLAERGNITSFGGGSGRNVYRNTLRLDAYVFVPKGKGLDEAESIAEQIAVLFRSYRDADISCFDATVYPGGDGADLKPPGLSSQVGNYFWACCEVSAYFDQVG